MEGGDEIGKGGKMKGGAVLGFCLFISNSQQSQEMELME